jgi:two-component system OmpR family response regulator
MTDTKADRASAGRVLLIEDEEATASGLREGLSANGWRVDCAAAGREGLALAAQGGFDVLIVDRMLPELDGLSLVTELRAKGLDTPALFLTALGSIADRVAGLDAGGDDYLVKPFAFAELNARLNALARRPGRQRDPVTLSLGHLQLDRLARTLRRGGREIELLPLEFKLLEFLMLNAGQVVTRKMLLEKVWGFQFDPQTNIVETHLSRLRGKIQAPGEASLIVTIRGAGYVIGAPASIGAGQP